MSDSKIYVFPETIREKAESGYPFVSFSFIKRNLPNNPQVYLYLPPGFSVPDGAAYGNVDLGIIGAKADLSNDNTKGALANEAGGKFLKMLGADAVFTKRQIDAGMALNPNTVLAFDNVTVRSFNFQFKLVAESDKEANQILIIENLFRAALYPEVKDNLYLEYPPTFKIQFYHGEQENTFMPQIQECFLANITTTYNASSNMFHADGAPSEIDMSLTFTETKANTRNDLYGDGDYTGGASESVDESINSIKDKIKDKLKSLRDIF